jgi:predicted anti-sigma-YlaC factor YlaD
MMTCQELDRLITPFIDGECSAAERADVLAHLQQCTECRNRVEAESTASHVLHAHAAIARTLGVAPAWRPRVFRLGQPTLPVRPTFLLLVAIVGVVLAGWWLRPAPVMAVGVIGDSFCDREHRFTRRFNVGDRECTLGCVKVGAEYVLVTETQVYRIRNQQLPELAALANQRVRMEGTVKDGQILVAKVTALDGGAAAAGSAQ